MKYNFVESFNKLQHINTLGDLNMSNELFRKLTEQELKEFAKAAWDNYEPGMCVDPLWHPAYRLECERINLQEIQMRAGA